MSEPETGGIQRVRVDRARCTGHGRCYSLFPDCFSYDDDGYGVVREIDPSDGSLHEKIEKAVLGCPENAISVVGIGGHR